MTSDSQEDINQHFQERDYSKPYGLPIKRILPAFPSFAERYFEPFFYIPNQSVVQHKNAGDQCALFHSNRMSLITLSPHHPILEEKKKVVSVDYEGEGDEFCINRLMNKVSGKRKRGGQKLKERSIICKLVCSDGSSHAILSCMKGTLVEINELLMQNPNLVVDDPWGKGFVAIIITKLFRVEPIKKSLLTYEQYIKVVEERKNVLQPKTDGDQQEIDESVKKLKAD